MVRCHEKNYGQRVVERFDDFNLINDYSILAHCIHINAKGSRAFKKEKCSFCCFKPFFNLNNNVEFFDYELLKDLKLIIGTDGLGSNALLQRFICSIY